MLLWGGVAGYSAPADDVQNAHLYRVCKSLRLWHPEPFHEGHKQQFVSRATDHTHGCYWAACYKFAKTFVRGVRLGHPLRVAAASRATARTTNFAARVHRSLTLLGVMFVSRKCLPWRLSSSSANRRITSAKRPETRSVSGDRVAQVHSDARMSYSRTNEFQSMLT